MSTIPINIQNTATPRKLPHALWLLTLPSPWELLVFWLPSLSAVLAHPPVLMNILVRCVLFWIWLLSNELSADFAAPSWRTEGSVAASFRLNHIPQTFLKYHLGSHMLSSSLWNTGPPHVAWDSPMKHLEGQVRVPHFWSPSPSGCSYYPLPSWCQCWPSGGSQVIPAWPPGPAFRSPFLCDGLLPYITLSGLQTLLFQDIFLTRAAH